MSTVYYYVEELRRPPPPDVYLEATHRHLDMVLLSQYNILGYYEAEERSYLDEPVKVFLNPIGDVISDFQIYSGPRNNMQMFCGDSRLNKHNLEEAKESLTWTPSFKETDPYFASYFRISVNRGKFIL